MRKMTDWGSIFFYGWAGFFFFSALLVIGIAVYQLALGFRPGYFAGPVWLFFFKKAVGTIAAVVAVVLYRSAVLDLMWSLGLMGVTALPDMAYFLWCDLRPKPAAGPEQQEAP